MIKTKEIYEELRENRDRIPNFNIYDLKAVLKHAKRKRDGLVEKLESKLNSMSPDKWNTKTGDDWLRWYDKEVFPEWKKFLDGEYKFNWDPKLTYNGINNDLIKFNFIVWLNEKERFDFLQEPPFSGHAPDVAEYLRENEGDYLVTNAIDLSYQDLHALAGFEAAFVEILALHIKKKLQIDNQKPAVELPLNNIIEIAITRVEDKETARSVLEIYCDKKEKNPKRSKLKIFEEEIEDEFKVSQSKFYDWIKAFEEAKKKYTHAQDS